MTRICSLLVAAFSLVSSAAAAQDDRDSSAEQQAVPLVKRAENLFSVGNYEAALSDFEHAYRLLEGHPRRYVVLHNLALCEERLFRYERALDYYERYLRDGGPEAEQYATVQAVVETLKGLLAELVIACAVNAEIWVDGRRARVSPGTLRLPPGEHTVEVRATLHETFRRQVRLQPRDKLRWRVELQALSDYRGPAPAYAWTGVALTGAALATGAVLGAATLHARHEGEREAVSAMHLRTRTTESAQRAIEHLSAATDIAFGAALLSGAATLVLLLVSDWNDHERGTVQAEILPGAAQLSVRGEL